MQYSPTRGVTCVELKPFSPATCLSFGQLMAGQTANLSFKLWNNEECCADFLIDCSSGGGAHFKICPCTGSVQPNSSTEVTISWKPEAVGNMRSNLGLQITMDGSESSQPISTRYSLRVVLVGTCLMPGETKAVHLTTPSSVTSREMKARGQTVEGRDTGSIKCTPKRMKEQSFVVTFETIQNAERRAEHERKLPIRSEHVEEHVCKRFLNYILMSDMFEEGDTPEGGVPHVSLKHILSSKHSPKLSMNGSERMTLRQYTKQRKMNHLRYEAQHLFCSLKQTVYRVFQLIEDKKIVIRQEMDIHIDQGLRQLVLNILLSITPLWLRIGLETVYCEVLPLTVGNDVRSLAHFIFTRMLNDPLILKRYSIAHVRNAFKDGYKEAISKFFMQKLFALLIFLDRAKSKRIIKSDPCLFYQTSTYKSIREVLITFNKELLSADGSLLKVLASADYQPTYEQTWYDEKPTLIGDLRTDLRDGATLVRLAGILSGNANLCNGMRGPPVSRLQKVHNVELAIKELSSIGVQLDGVNASAIVAGHREKTLHLLWQIICFKLGFPKDPMQSPVFFEIMRLRRKYRHLRNEPTGILRQIAGSDMSPADVFTKWIAAVCSTFGVEVDNLHLSLFDGRALCCLISYYLPFVLPRENIQFETTMCNNGEKLISYEELKRNNMKNRSTFLNAVEEIGDVPWLLPFDKLVRIQGMRSKNERVLLLCLNSLASSLFTLSRQHRAASVIQHAWREHRSKLLKERAATTIQRYWRQCRRRTVLAKRVLSLGRMSLAARKIQKNWRIYKQRKETLQAIKIAEVEVATDFAEQNAVHHRVFTGSTKPCSEARCDVRIQPPTVYTATSKANAIAEGDGGKELSSNISQLSNFTSEQNEIILWVQSYGRRRLVLEKYVREVLAASLIQRVWRSYRERRNPVRCYQRNMFVQKAAAGDTSFVGRAEALTAESSGASEQTTIADHEGHSMQMDVMSADANGSSVSSEYMSVGPTRCFEESSSLPTVVYKLSSVGTCGEQDTTLTSAKSNASPSISTSSKFGHSANAYSCNGVTEEERDDVHSSEAVDSLPEVCAHVCQDLPSSREAVDGFPICAPAYKCTMDPKECGGEERAQRNGVDPTLELLCSAYEERGNNCLNFGTYSENGESNHRNGAFDSLRSQKASYMPLMANAGEGLGSQLNSTLREPKAADQSVLSHVTNISDISYHFDDPPTMSFATSEVLSPQIISTKQFTSDEHQVQNITTDRTNCSHEETTSSTEDENESSSDQTEVRSSIQSGDLTSSSSSSMSTGTCVEENPEVQPNPSTVEKKSETSDCKRDLLDSSEGTALLSERALAGNTASSVSDNGKSLSISTPNYSRDLSTFEQYGSHEVELSAGSLSKCNNLFDEITKAEGGDLQSAPCELSCPLSGIVSGLLRLDKVASNEDRQQPKNSTNGIIHELRSPEKLQKSSKCTEVEPPPRSPPFAISTPLRAKCAVDRLLSCKQLVPVRNMLLELHEISTVSEENCRCLVEQGVPGVLYRVIRRLNRGYACMETKTIAVKCLNEIAFHENLRSSIVATPMWLDCLSDVLLSAKNGNDELLSAVVSVLRNVASLEEAQEEVRSNVTAINRWIKVKDFFAKRAVALGKRSGQSKAKHCDFDVSPKHCSLLERNNGQLSSMKQLLLCYNI
uniref:Calponin-homology (CH) domain-containing protein n=1 Tax=Trichuris muris TaxID=70415 RepID=A0A5S6R688_TRIMR